MTTTRRTLGPDGVWREQRDKLDALVRSGKPVKVRWLPYTATTLKAEPSPMDQFWLNECAKISEEVWAELSKITGFHGEAWFHFDGHTFTHIDRAARLAAPPKETAMTTIVSIKTVDGDTEKDWKILVGDVALAKVLRKFNVTANVEVDATKVLCAALIQQMIDLQASAGGNQFIGRNAAMAITDLEKVQMLCVKANFAEA